MGALVLPALHGGGAMAHQIMLMLSAADDFGGPGKYKLMAAKTGYAVTLMDTMGDALADPQSRVGARIRRNGQSGSSGGHQDHRRRYPQVMTDADACQVWRAP